MYLETKRLGLNPITAADKTLYCDIYSSMQLMRYVGEPLSPIEVVKSWDLVLKYVHSSKNIMRTWAITELGSNCRNGLGGLVWDKTDAQRANIGCMFLAQAHGKGFATEFLEKLAEYAFQILELNELYTHSMLENISSFKLFSRLGYSHKHIEEDNPLKKACYYWSMTKKQWLTL